MNIGSIKNKINIKENKDQNKAFSLIELSIVLIIIGLLVAGVTGGASLIESAKIRAFANEMLSYRQAFAVFKVAKGRLPGDLNDDGFMGNNCNGTGCVTETYTTSSFSAPYNTKAPNQISGPFVDLYLEGLIDFMPDSENITVIGKGNPYSKIYKDGYYDFNPMGNYMTSEYIKNTKFGTIYLRYHNPNGLSPKIIKKLDTIIDDGIWDSGDFRGSCSANISYDDAIDKNFKCAYTRYKVNMI